MTVTDVTEPFGRAQPESSTFGRGESGVGLVVVEGAAVELDDQALLDPSAIRLDEAVAQEDGNVQPRHRQPAALQEAPKAFLQLASRQPGADLGHTQDGADGRRSAAPGVAGEEGREGDAIAVAANLGLTQGTIDAAVIQNRSEVEERTRDSGDRDRREDCDLIGR
jgi:hypothetical protein